MTLRPNDYDRNGDIIPMEIVVGKCPIEVGGNCPLRAQGEWIVTAEDNDGVHRICCPFCRYEKGSNNTDPIIVTFSNFPKFCENCGADMRKGGAE